LVKMNENKSAASRGTGVTVELRDERGNLISTHEASEQELLVGSMLRQARVHVDQGEPSQALQLVLQAVRETQGEQGIFDVLNQARRDYGLDAPNPNFTPSTSSPSLSSLFASLSTNPAASPSSSSSSAASSSSQPVPMAEDDWGLDPDPFGLLPPSEGKHDIPTNKGQNAVIAEDSDEDRPSDSELLVHKNILVAAYEDGSSFLCDMCNGLVKKDRAEAHLTMWCPALNVDDDD